MVKTYFHAANEAQGLVYVAEALQGCRQAFQNGGLQNLTTTTPYLYYFDINTNNHRNNVLAH